jgi:hypothetical protein
MNNSLRMQVAHSLYYVSEYSFDLILINDSLAWISPNMLIQMRSIDIFNHQINLVVTFKRIIKLHDSWMA